MRNLLDPNVNGAAADCDGERTKQPQPMPTPAPQSAMPVADAAHAAWVARVPAARIAWGKLGDLELLGTDGNPVRLASLVRDRYAITRADAEQQVHAFLAADAA